MDFLRPASREEALAAKAGHPTAAPIAGGTDAMVETDFGHRRPEYPLDLHSVVGLHAGETGGQGARLGTCVPYGELMRSLRTELPGPAPAPWIRHRAVAGAGTGPGSAKVIEPARAKDIRKVLDPPAVTGRIQGGTAAQDPGVAAMEEEILVAPRTVRVRNPSLPDHLVPTILGTPAPPVGVLGLADEHAPHGPRDAGEAPPLSSSPAVLAAIRDATGFGPHRTPVRPEHRTGTA